jgi:UDP-N-acetylmuramoylalanine--D-glutamate ligase
MASSNPTVAVSAPGKVLLAGGYDKQVDLSEMARVMAAKVKVAALMGQTGPHLAALLERRVPARVCSSFDEAFDWAVEQSAPGDVVLLSPACASYDQYESFEQRGDDFRRLVEAL